MPLQSTSGSASYDAFGGGVPVVPKYIEDYFSTFLYSGTGAAQTITNGIDLSTKGGLVWYKRRSGVGNNVVVDTSRGMTSGSSPLLNTNTTDSQTAINNYVIANTTGFSFGSNATGTDANASGSTYVSWSWAKAPKFFDVVTYTGNGTNGRTVAHSLGSTPGCIIVKRTDASNGWAVYHRAMNASPQDYMMRLNATDGAFTTTPSRWNNTLPTSTEFTLSGNDEVNGSGATYVAYLFAHNAGGFGLTGTDNVISCGSYTGVGGGNVATITLGYEPQWILVKRTDNSAGGNWAIFDNMRGMSVNSTDNASMLNPNVSDSESVLSAFKPTATGFQTGDNFTASGGTYIYIAIRRGPMKVPTSGTSVFAPVQYTSATTPPTVTTGFPVDMIIDTIKGPANENRQITDRLRGSTINLYRLLYTNATDAESSSTFTNAGYDLASNTSTRDGFFGTVYGSGYNCITWNFRRAPSFFDEVCWTSNDTYPQVLNHNLTVAPELIIRKPRSIADEWVVGFDFQASSYKKMALNTTAAATSYGSYSSGELPGKPIATQFTDQGSASGRTFVAYLFATCAGVSKVGSYTGTGTTLQIDCGFTGGARFVLIKRASSTGDWYVWDSARGIVSGNDPYLLLNSTAAEVTSTDYIDTYSAGFEISSTAPAAINASGGTFIFLAIA